MPPDGPPTPAPSESPTLITDFGIGDEIVGPTVVSGPDLITRLNPDDPIQAANIADIEALLEATGADIDQLAMLNAESADGDAFVGAIRVEGAETEAVKAGYVESTFDDLGKVRVEESEIGGKSVTLIFDDAAPEQPALVVYAVGDTVWVVSGTDAAVAQVIASLP